MKMELVQTTAAFESEFGKHCDLGVHLGLVCTGVPKNMEMSLTAGVTVGQGLRADL